MSKDYGLHCSDCNQDWVEDNVKEENARGLLLDIKDFAEIIKIKDRMQTSLIVYPDFISYELLDLGKLTNFILEHY